VLGSVVRAALFCIAIVALAGITTGGKVPDGWLIPTTIVYLLVWTVLYIWFYRFQLRGIRKASFPQVRAIETLIVGLVLFLSIFAKAYYLMSYYDADSFTQEMNHFDAYYFTITVLATVGFGDITPVTTIARSISMVQMILDLVIIAITVRLVTQEVKKVQQEKAGVGSQD
jgi:hypothetical protein